MRFYNFQAQKNANQRSGNAILEYVSSYLGNAMETMIVRMDQTRQIVVSSMLPALISIQMRPEGLIRY